MAGGFAFLMSLSLFIFCYLQYCPGWIPGYRQCFPDEEGMGKKGFEKATPFEARVELGRPVEFQDLGEPDIR